MLRFGLSAYGGIRLHLCLVTLTIRGTILMACCYTDNFWILDRFLSFAASETICLTSGSEMTQPNVLISYRCAAMDRLGSVITL